MILGLLITTLLLTTVFLMMTQFQEGIDLHKNYILCYIHGQYSSFDNHSRTLLFKSSKKFQRFSGGTKGHVVLNSFCEIVCIQVSLKFFDVISEIKSGPICTIYKQPDLFENSNYFKFVL